MRFTCNSTRSLSLGRLLVKLIKLYKSGLRNQKIEMVMKPVRRLFYMFLWIWWCTTFNSIPNILILLRNKNVALLYSISICGQKTKDCTPSGSFQHKLQYHWVFLFLVMFATFNNQFPLLTMYKVTIALVFKYIFAGTTRLHIFLDMSMITWK